MSKAEFGSARAAMTPVATRRIAQKVLFVEPYSTKCAVRDMWRRSGARKVTAGDIRGGVAVHRDAGDYAAGISPIA